VGGIQLERRTRQLLHAVIQEFVRTGRPVGSRTLAKAHPDKLSPATIRNLMADLEEMGLLQQPHTSAGRIPTDRAYRLYVDSLELNPRLDPGDRRLVNDAFRDLEGNFDQVLERVSHFLSSLSHQIGVVLCGSIDRIDLRRMEFVSLGNRRVLALFVSVSGMVSQKLLQLDEEIGQEDLDRVGRYLSDEFAGQSLRRIRERLLEMMAEEKARYDQLLAQVLAVGNRFFEPNPADSQVYVEGTANLVGQPDFPDLERMRALFRTFEEKGKVVQLLNRCVEGDGVAVRIGAEQGDPELEGTSVIASPFFFQDRALGTLGIIGPTRMEYARLIAMVDQISHLVSRHLTHAAE
jgi:heat-inducible transcriptional repressor